MGHGSIGALEESMEIGHRKCQNTKRSSTLFWLEALAVQGEGGDVFIPRHLGPWLYDKTSCYLHLVPTRLQQVSGVLRVEGKLWPLRPGVAGKALQRSDPVERLAGMCQ